MYFIYVFMSYDYCVYPRTKKILGTWMGKYGNIDFDAYIIPINSCIL